MTDDLKELKEALVQDFGMDNEWRVHAKCRTLPTDLSNALFFPVGKRDPYKKERESICFNCPVRQECETYGNVTGDVWGAWGGYLAGDRRRRRREAS